MTGTPEPAAPRQAGRLDWVDTGRGLAILLVALYHSTQWLSGPGLDLRVWSDISTVLSSMRMPLFFVLSGLFARKWLTADWSAVLRTKVLLFAWVFMVWQVIGSAAILLGLHASGKPVNALASVRDLLLSPAVPRFELWFIWALAWFFVIAKLTRRIPWIAQLVVAGVLSAFALTVWLDRTTGLTGSAKFYFFFLAGLYLRQTILAFGSTTRRLLLWATVAVWAAVSVTFFALHIRGVFGLYFLNCVIGVFAGVAISRGLCRIPVLSRLGRQTLPIYLAHTPIVIVVSFVVSLPAVFAIVEPVTPLVPPVGAAIAVALAVLLYHLSRRSFLRYLYEPPHAQLDRVWSRLRKVRS